VPVRLAHTDPGGGSIARLLVVALILFVGVPAYQAAGQTVHGVIVDDESGEALAGASVELRGQSLSRGTLSDLRGRFSFDGTPAGRYSLLVRYLGFTEYAADISVGPDGLETRVLLVRGILDFETIVVTGSRKAEKLLDSPSAVAVISGSDAQRDVGASPVEILRRIPSVTIAQTGIQKWEVSSRGFADVFDVKPPPFLDYRRASLGGFGTVFYGLLPLSHLDIDRVEVISGPASALYGPGVDGGAINFISRDPFVDKGTAVAVGGGQQSFREAQLWHAGGIGSAGLLAYKVTAVLNSAEDWKYSNSDPEDLVVTQDDAIQRRYGTRKRSLTAELGYRITEAGTLRGVYTRSEIRGHGNSGVGTLRWEKASLEQLQLRYADTHWFTQAYVTRLVAPNVWAYSFPDLTGDGTPDGFIANDIAVTLQAQRSQSIGSLALTAGMDVEYMEPRTEGTFNGRFEDSDETTNTGLYVQGTLPAGRRLEFTGAFRVDHVSMLEAQYYSPRIAAVYKPRPTTSIRLSFNRAFGGAYPGLYISDSVVGYIGPVGLRFLGPLGGHPWKRDSSYLGRSGSDVVAASLFGTHLGEDMPIGAELSFAFDDLVAGFAAMDPATASSALEAHGILASPSEILEALSGVSLGGLSPGVMAVLDLATGTPNQIGVLEDVPAGVLTRTDSYELGFRTVLNDRLMIGLDIYNLRIRDRLTPTAIESPFVFAPQLATDLTGTLSESVDATLAQALVAIGLDQGFVPTAQDPVGVVEPLTNDTPAGTAPEILLTYRNVGSLSAWGADLTLEYHPSDAWAFYGGASWASDDVYDYKELGLSQEILEVSLNAPTRKAKFGADYQQDRWAVGLHGRYNGGFWANSGIYQGPVSSYLVLDLTTQWNADTLYPGLRVDLSAKNLLNNRHREFFAAPVMGRFATLRVTLSL
jgi:iron complex outermembrane receptor protein